MRRSTDVRQNLNSSTHNSSRIIANNNAAGGLTSSRTATHNTSIHNRGDSRASRNGSLGPSGSQSNNAANPRNYHSVRPTTTTQSSNSKNNAVREESKTRGGATTNN